MAQRRFFSLGTPEYGSFKLSHMLINSADFCLIWSTMPSKLGLNAVRTLCSPIVCSCMVLVVFGMIMAQKPNFKAFDPEPSTNG